MFSDMLFVGIVIVIGLICLVVVANWLGKVITDFVDMLTALKEKED